jgi:hypothetical protein
MRLCGLISNSPVAVFPRSDEVLFLRLTLGSIVGPSLTLRPRRCSAQGALLGVLIHQPPASCCITDALDSSGGCALYRVRRLCLRHRLVLCTLLGYGHILYRRGLSSRHDFLPLSRSSFFSLYIFFSSPPNSELRLRAGNRPLGVSSTNFLLF